MTRINFEEEEVGHECLRDVIVMKPVLLAGSTLPPPPPPAQLQETPVVASPRDTCFAVSLKSTGSRLVSAPVSVSVLSVSVSVSVSLALFAKTFASCSVNLDRYCAHKPA